MHTHKSEESALSATAIPESSSIRGIRYLTCQGGGMKGLGELGAVERLEELGVLAQLEEVAGSSAGGIMATLIAIGCTAAEVREEMLKLDFRALQDKREPGWLESSKIKDLFGGAAAGMDSVDDKISAIKRLPVVGNLLYNLAPPILGVRGLKGVFNLAHKGVQGVEAVEDVAGLGLGGQLGLWEGDALKSLLGALIARKTGKPDLTFAELAKLAEAPGSPFKKLHLTGSNITDGVLEVYNAQNFPEMSILEGARISASFPGGFKPVISVNKEGKKIVRVDGGLLENLPDVFNKPPYLSPDEMNAEGGNPRAFALALVTPQSKKAKSVKNGMELAKALFSSKLSDKYLYKKYGRNIAKIDTMEVDTLEFDASEEKKSALIESGRKEVDSAFAEILQVESERKDELLKEMSLRELIRIEVALKIQMQKLSKESGKEEELKALKEELVEVVKELKARQAPSGAMDKIRQEEKAKLDKKHKLLDVHALTDSELTKLCLDKRAELEQLNKELQEKIDALKLAKRALIMNRDEVIAEFEKDDHKNGFFNRLQTLKKMEIAINDVILEKEMQSDTPNELTDKKLQELLEQRKQFIVSCVKNYADSKKGNNPLLADFFEELLVESNKPDFKVPHTRHHLHQYCSRDIESCLEYIEEAESELRRGKADIHLFKKHQTAFQQRGARSERFSTLLNLKNELDKSIYRKKTLVTKLNQFLLDKAPKFTKVIVPFMKMVSFVSFVCWLPLALPTVPIAKLIGHYSKDPEVKDTMQRTIRFFAKTDVDQDIKLRGLRDTSALFIKRASDDYVKSDASEVSYLYRLHGIYLKNAGLDCKEIFDKKPEESQAQYEKRLAEESRKLNLLAERISRPLPKVPAPKESLPEVGRSLDHFRRGVASIVLHTAKREAHTLPPKRVDAKAAQKERVKEQQFRIIHAEFILEMDLKMQRKEEMTLKEVIEYVKSLKALNREIPEDFRKQHEKTLLAMKDSDSLAKPEQKAPTKGDLLVAKKDFVHKKRQGHFSKNSKAKDGVHHSAHHRTLKNR